MKILLLFLALVALPLQVAQANPTQYKIHAGDILSISIWNEDSLQRELQVLPDGTISFPLAGVITVEGKALKDIQNELIKKLADFIPDAEVNV